MYKVVRDSFPVREFFCIYEVQTWSSLSLLNPAALCAVVLLQHDHEIENILESGRVWVVAIVNGNIGETHDTHARMSKGCRQNMPSHQERE